MILAARKHLFAMNIFCFFVILILQKFIQIFCIIEEKTCKDSNCRSEKPCRCGASNVKSPASASLLKTSTIKSTSNLGFSNLEKSMCNSSYREGHNQMFVQD